MLYKLHMFFLCVLLVASFAFAPFAAFLYADPAAGGITLTALSLLWMGMPVYIGCILITSLILQKQGKTTLAKQITGIPYVLLALTGILLLVYFKK